jgi:hypothetical protein
VLVAIALGGAAVLIAVGVVVRLLVRRSRPSTIGTDAVGGSGSEIGAGSGETPRGGWITQAQLEAAAVILHSRLDPPPETVIVVNTTDALLADALGQEHEARAAAPIDVFVVRGSFTDHGAVPPPGSEAPTGTTGVVGLGRGSTRMVAWALIGEEANLEAMMRDGVVMALPGGSGADRDRS